MTDLDKSLLRRLGQMQASNCPSLAALGDFLDKKGSVDDRQALELHLRGCPACVNRLLELRELAHLEKGRKTDTIQVAEHDIHYGVREEGAPYDSYSKEGAPYGDAKETAERDIPPPSLIAELKRLVPGEEKVQQSPLVSRITEAVASLSAAVWQWTSPHMFGGVVAVSAVAVFLFVFGPTLLQHLGQGEQGETVAGLTVEEQRTLSSLATITGGATTLQQRLVSTLEKLPKNLFLEETRGATNVEVYKKAAPGTVLVVSDQSLGSGVVVSDQGEVLTNWHVVQGAERLAVVFKPQRGVEIQEDLAFAASIITKDEVADLALLKILTPPSHLPVLSLGDIGRVEVGQDVHAIGHPEGEVWTYTTGIISQVRPHYQWHGSDNLAHQSTVIQTQTALNPGNSGGPLLNDRAEVIGINSFRGEGEGLNYAVAVDTVKSFLQQARSTSASSPASARPASYKTEAYGSNLMGIYVNTRVPPPDVWLSRDAARKLVIAKGSKSMTQIDTVIQEGSQPKTWVYYSDLDCDGKVDLIGYDVNGDDIVDRYDLPQKPVRIVDLAGELVQALRKGIVPYPQLHVCQ